MGVKGSFGAEVKLKVKVKWYSSSWQVISELRGVTCHMGSQCYLPSDTSELAPPNSR